MSDDIEPFQFRAPLTICVDVKHPQAFLALGPARALASELEIDVDWLPFPVAPAKPPPEVLAPDRAENRGARHRLIRARYQEMDLARYAAAQGLIIRDRYRADDTTLVSQGLLWLRGCAPEVSADFLERVFAGYWNGTLDVGDVASLGGIVESLGRDSAAFSAYVTSAGPEALDELRGRLVAAGVFTVPSLVVEGEVFVGRAHLPMARWLLTGKAGPPPI